VNPTLDLRNTAQAFARSRLSPECVRSIRIRHGPQRVRSALLTSLALVILIGLFHPVDLLAQDRSKISRVLRTIADGVIRESTFQFVDQVSGKHFDSPEETPAGTPLAPDGPYTDWRYWNGVLNLAMLRLGDSLREPAYTDFVKKNIEFDFDSYVYFQKRYANEGKWNYPFGQFFTMEELDDYGAMGASVIEVMRRNPGARYQRYIDKAAEYVMTKQNRLDDGTLVRSFPKRWTLWADDLYMSVVFLSRMGFLTGESKYFDDAALQVINFHKHLFDESKGLMHHDWYSDGERPGIAFWGRANGWALLAQVDLLDRLPYDHPKRQELLILLKRHLAGIVRYQSNMGLWHQLLDRDDSYLETSCSAMFTYALARAVNKKYVESTYAAAAKRGWEGVMCRIQPDGRIAGVCTGTGVSDDLAFYYQRPTPLNDVHGVGAAILAGTEILALSK